MGSRIYKQERNTILVNLRRSVKLYMLCNDIWYTEDWLEQLRVWIGMEDKKCDIFLIGSVYFRLEQW